MTPEAWRTASIGEIASFVGSGVTPRGGASVYEAKGIPFLRSQNVHFGGLRLDDVAFISPVVHAEMSRSQVCPRDVLLNITGASIGRCTIVPDDLGPANVNQHVCILRTHPSIAEPAYVSHYLSGREGQASIRERQAGLSREALNYEQIRAMTIRLPPVAEQRKIAAILTSCDRVIEATQAVLDQLAVVKKAMMADLLTRGIPGRHTRFRQTEIGEVPEGWKITTLGEVLDGIDSGWSPQCEPCVAADHEWGVLKISAVSWGVFRPEENKKLPAGLAPRAEAEVKVGDLLVSRANTPELVGRCVLVQQTRPLLMLSDKLLRLRVSTRRAVPTFIRLVFDTFATRQQIEEGATGSSRSMRNISQEKLRAITIPLPSLGEQAEITGALETSSERLLAESTHLAALTATKSALAAALLSGEVRVTPDAEAP